MYNGNKSKPDATFLTANLREGNNAAQGNMLFSRMVSDGGTFGDGTVEPEGSTGSDPRGCSTSVNSIGVD